MATRAEVVAAARSWIGTPFHHQAELKGVGCDCGGLLRGVCIELELFPADYRSLPEAQPFVGYARSPDGESMVKCCETFMRPIERSQMQPGDVVLVRWDVDPQHVAILGDYRHGGLSIIHALGTRDGRGGVIETRLMFSRAMAFVAAYALRGVA
jgi:NlpC/P60 family putative phage cell wall peptidase